MSKIKSIALILFSDLKYHSVCWYILAKEKGLDLKKRNTNMLQNLDDWIMISNPYYNLK